MANVKTAISIEEDLFKQVEQICEEMKLTRSGVFAKALEEFVERHQNKLLLERINEAYEEAPDDAERRYLRQMRRRHRKLIHDQW